MKSLALLLAFAVCLAFVRLSAADAAYTPGVVVTPLLETRTDSAGHKLVYPAAGDAQVTAVLVEIPAGQKTGWHKHTVPCLAYMLEGEVRVELASGGVKTAKAGEAFAEVVDLLHNGFNPGPGPARLVMFVVGTAGQPYTVRAPEPAAVR